jgi:hypothetical protein
MGLDGESIGRTARHCQQLPEKLRTVGGSRRIRPEASLLLKQGQRVGAIRG